MGYYRRRRYRRYSSWDYARRHMSEAAQLSKDVGGTDEDVKRYFFGLSGPQLRPVLRAYEREHGKSARQYAEKTISNWRSGATQMSGAVATRLYKLLPKFMPLEQKYALVESLWTKYAPRSEYSVSFGRNADVRAITETVRNHVNATVNDHTVPDNLKHRFVWLADGDSILMEQLLNYFLERDKKDAVAVQHAVVSMILPQLQNGDALTDFKREVKIGGHVVHVFFDPRTKEVKLSHGSPCYISPPDYSWIGGVLIWAAIIALIWLLSAKR
jgi:hypothetical protein